MENRSINSNEEKQTIIGWREWVILPELAVPPIKAKIDTGARTSTLHAFSIEDFRKKGVHYVRFGIHPKQRNTEIECYCEMPIYDKRFVTDSGGHTEERWIIKTLIMLGNFSWPVEITLTNRDSMRFRMLLGRTALQKEFLVAPHQSYLFGKQKRFL